MTVRVSQGAVAAEIQLEGCMVSPVFELDGEEVRPLYTAPWPEHPEDPLLSKLRGDFLCVPFGIAPASTEAFPPAWRFESQHPEPESGYAHGYPANVAWRVAEAGPESAEFVLDLLQTEAVAEVRRVVTCRAGAVEIEDRLTMRRDARLPLGLHPIVRLPEQPGQAVVAPPGCAGYRTYPVPTDASSVLLPDASFADLGRAPLRQGGTLDLSRLPLDFDTEELVQLCDLEKPSLAVENRAEGYRVGIEWDPVLRHCLLWISNRGRKFAPWNGRNLCLGVEPVTSAFDLGTAISAGPNPLADSGLATAVDLVAGRTRVLRHRFTLGRLD